MDNQLETTIGWFAAILEGEGCFRNTKQSGIQVRILNTDIDIISRCEQFLKNNHIYSATYIRKRKNRKPIYDICVTSQASRILNYPQILYDLIEPCLECRRNEFQSILGSSQSIREPSVDFDWLIGIFEAEGFFSLTTSYKGHAFYEIGVCNTNQNIIDKIILNLRALKCPYYVQSKGQYRKEDHYKEASAIRIVGMMRCDRFLRITDGKWRASRNMRRSSLMREFINERFQMKPTDKFSERQLRILQTMKDLNT